MHLRYGYHSLERIQRDQGSRYSGPASLHDNCGKKLKSTSAERTRTRQPIIQFPQMVGRFVVPTDYQRQDRRGGLARIISEKVNSCPLRDKKEGSLVKVTHVLVLWGYGH
jgi:hypothetical protein